MGLTPYEFLPDLEEAGALTEEEVRHIKSLDKRAKQMEAFLSILKERGISSCRKTLDILAEKDYGPAIREMRKEKTGCDITFAVNGNFDVEEVNALQQKTKDHTTEQSSGIGKYDLRFSVLGPRKDKIEKILKDFIESEDFSCKLKDMGPEDISVTNGSVIVHVTFKCQEDYDKFSVAVSEGKLFDIVSRMWDEVKWKHQINKQDASMIVYIQNVPGRLADSGKTECSAAFFIDTNNEFLTEELCSGTLIKYLKESHRDISEAIRIRKEHPFDRRAQSQELLKFLRNESFEFIQNVYLQPNQKQ
ncbi:hypothetical protein FSP39_010895 [Pinctada imbricata]|uniref:CARD domain-containing protein n=1 Tax=Pinctada imbricata TaxID=66713 RepID=A0AA88XN58_PINIB|nr:hypothetical protein FSP39_010895 [Pinctada imbricata]